MNTNNKTLADVQPGGRVRLGDVLPPLPKMQRFTNLYGETYAYSAEQMRDYARAALSAQPSPGGQGDIKARFTEWVKANSYNPATFASGRFMGDGVQIAWEAVQALAARQPVYEGHTWISDYVLAGLRERAALPLQLRNGEVWHWQGDGHDFPESLVCPVIMSAETLRALLAARQPVGEPVVTYCGRRLTPEGTRECWGVLEKGVEDLPRNTKLYAAPPAQALDLSKLIAKIDQAWSYLSTALDDLDSSPDRRPSVMVDEAMGCLRQALTGVPNG
ncbi:hypothetical protein [Stenotrophomonas maltophilia]|uniref:hypothetical protein n=1 Tax=Stenotrophomonas maltophilia TaxID=40324 RepID=UPI000DA786AF|nr:hypothetical protein [Stenotrophomonas maltophilia]PZS72829.1 hypothetical protein A7X75_00705 [Stenotrophomonas maltophilia]